MKNLATCTGNIQRKPSFYTMPKQKYNSTKTKKELKNVPYAKGYHPLSAKKRILAIGFKLKNLPAEYSDVCTQADRFFHPVPEPTSIDDWLAQYVEEGQSFRQYLKENPWISTRKQKFIRQKFVPSGRTLCEKYPDGKIYIASISKFSNENICFDDLIDYVQRFLCLPVRVLEGLELEKKNSGLIFVENPLSRPNARIKKSSLQTRHDARTNHTQINVDSILPKLSSVIPHDALCLVGLTPSDLYGDESDLFVAGMAAGNKRVAIFSLMRYNPALTFSKENWYDIRESKVVTPKEKQKLILQRSCKLVVHEICHLLGLPHCVYYHCCMNGSGHLQEDFSQPMMLCPVDLHKLQALIGFDVMSRYHSLLKFYQKHNFTEEADWTERRLSFLKSKERDISSAVPNDETVT